MAGYPRRYADFTHACRKETIRLAIGASENRVLLQFLVEAVLLSAAGGLLGIAFGIGAIEATQR